MKRVISIIIMSLMILTLAGCSGDSTVGFWSIDQVTAGDISMTTEDAKSIGLSTVGSVKLQKSGACVVDLLGEESEGTWKKADDGTITVTYGKEKLTLTGSIDDEGIMTLRDDQGSEYILSK